MEPRLTDEFRVERRREQVPLLQDDGSFLELGQYVDPSPIRSIHGARMKTPRTRWSIPRTSMSASNESTWRP